MNRVIYKPRADTAIDIKVILVSEATRQYCCLSFRIVSAKTSFYLL